MKQILNIPVYQTLPQVLFFRTQIGKTFGICTIQNSYAFKGQKVLRKLAIAIFVQPPQVLHEATLHFPG